MKEEKFLWNMAWHDVDVRDRYMEREVGDWMVRLGDLLRRLLAVLPKNLYFFKRNLEKLAFWQKNLTSKIVKFPNSYHKVDNI